MSVEQETCERCGRTFANAKDYDSHDCIITALPLGYECAEEVVRRGMIEPCDLPAVAVRINPDYTGMVYPVCKRHVRGAMVPLGTLLDDMRQVVLQEEPSGAEVTAAAESLHPGLFTLSDSHYGIEFDNLAKDRPYRQEAAKDEARAALVAAREVSGR